MDELDPLLIARRSIKGLFALVSRTFLVQILSIVSNFILTLYLDPSLFGLFFVVSAINVFLTYFQDIGLAALIIQQKDAPTLRELRTTFTIQQILVLGVIIPVLFFSSFIQQHFNLSESGIVILYAYLFSFFVSSLKTIPTVLLERNLDFHKLVIPQIVENVAYSIALIIFAINGFELWTFTYAILIRSVIGLPIIYYIQPWSIGFSFDLRVFKRLVSLGSPFQANSILALIKDDALNLYIASILPLSQMGYIGFGQKWAFQPLRLFMDNIIKVIFPAFSRLQHDQHALRSVVEKSLFLISFFIFPMVAAFILFAPYLIAYIPKYQKWEPALVSLTFFSLNALFASISVPLTNFLNAVGKVKTTLRFMVGWTILIWVLTPLCIHWFGYNGVAVASAIVAASVLLILFPVKKTLQFSFITPIWKQIIATICMVISILILKIFITSFGMLFIVGIISGAFYLLVMVLLGKKELFQTYSFIKDTIKKE